jgi:hypothetical protein
MKETHRCGFDVETTPLHFTVGAKVNNSSDAKLTNFDVISIGEVREPISSKQHPASNSATTKAHVAAEISEIDGTL